MCPPRSGRHAGRPLHLHALPNIAEDFPADAGFHGGAAGHDAARRREDARAEARQHFRHVFLAEVDPAARAADALHARDEPLAVRTVLQEQAQRLGLGGRLLGRVVQQLEPLNVPFVLEDAGDLGLRRDEGMSTRVPLAVTALRIRVSISAIGSVISLNLQIW